MAADTAETPPLGAHVRRGAMWTVGNSLLMRLANVVVMAVVAHLIVPEEFGVFTLAMTAFAFVSSVAELGIGSAAARADLDLDKIAPTVVTIACTSSVMLGALMAVFAGPIAGLLGAPETTAPLRILALVVAMIGPFAVPGAQLQREFKQQRVFVANFVAFFPSNALLFGLLLAHVDGAIAFAWSRVVGQLAVGVIMCLSVSRLYRPGFAPDQLRMLFGFGLPLAGASLVGMVVGNVDFLLVGRLLGVATVGVYTLAVNIANWASSAIGSMLNGVVLPAFSIVKQDPDRLQDAVRRAVRMVAVVACLICGMTAGLSHPLIDTLYGRQWSAAAPVLVILALYGAATVLITLLSNIVVAMGRTISLFFVQVAALVVLAPSLYVGIHLGGMIGAAVAHLVVMLGVTLPVFLRSVRSTTGVRTRGIVAALVPPLIAGVLAGTAAHLVGLLDVPDVYRLLLGGVVGSAIYVVLMVRDLVGIVGAHRFPRWATDAVRSTEGLRSWLVGRASEDDEPEEPDELGEPDEPDGPHAAGRDPERP